MDTFFLTTEHLFYKIIVSARSLVIVDATCHCETGAFPVVVADPAQRGNLK